MGNNKIELIKHNTSELGNILEAVNALPSINDDTTSFEGIALIDSGQCGDSVCWNLYDNGTLYIYGEGATYNYSDKGLFDGNNRFTDVIIKDGVTSIGVSLFSRTGLVNVVIPNSVTDIMGGAFIECRNLEKITIPNGVIRIHSSAFEDCEKLSSVIIPDSVMHISDYAFFECNSLTDVLYNGTKEQWDSIIIKGYNEHLLNATLHCEYEEVVVKEEIEVVVPTITQNGDYEFLPQDGKVMSKVSVSVNVPISDGDTSGNDKFFNLVNKTITEVTAADLSGITTLASYVFYECKQLTNITIPDSVTSIGSSTFSGCTKLASITIPDSVTSIGSYAFHACSNFTNIIVPNSVTSLGTYAFYNCYNLVNLALSDNITSISNYAFYYCSALSNIIIPDSVTSIGNYAFGYGRSFTNITIPNSVTSIGNNAFQYCSKLADITIGNGVTSIGNNTFIGCSALTDIYLKSTTPPTLGNTAAIPNNIQRIHVPVGSGDAYKSATNWSSYANQIIEDIVI